MTEKLEIQIHAGSRVMFRPKPSSLQWAAGIRIVKGFESGGVLLECGNVKLLAA